VSECHLAAREQRAVNQAGGYVPSPKLDTLRASVLSAAEQRCTKLNPVCEGGWCRGCPNWSDAFFTPGGTRYHAD
jgi:hypothetical protein